MTAYYNEIDPFAAAWLRELIKAGHIAVGEVDERSIEDVCPDELAGYTQCHFFAGIGVWSHALRAAGWPDDRPVWTGSCPCQPFSAAGKGGGTADERHLWPAWHHLIRECRPRIIFGEQVEKAINFGWLDLVQTDLEGEGYAVGAAVVPAAGVGAPHIRSRLWFVAHVQQPGLEGQSGHGDGSHKPGRLEAGQNRSIAAQGVAGGVEYSAGNGRQPRRPESGERCVTGGCGAGELGIADGTGSQSGREGGKTARYGDTTDPTGGACELADTAGENPVRLPNQPASYGTFDKFLRANATNGFWGVADWLFCRDGKWRPVEPGTFPLAHGAAARVGRLRGYGNAINAEAARQVILAAKEIAS